jgi:hypothetical protein
VEIVDPDLGTSTKTTLREDDQTSLGVLELSLTSTPRLSDCVITSMREMPDVAVSLPYGSYNPATRKWSPATMTRRPGSTSPQATGGDLRKAREDRGVSNEVARDLLAPVGRQLDRLASSLDRFTGRTATKRSLCSGYP